MTAIAPDDRFVTLDAVRGIAVMGILAMNIVSFAMPQPAYTSPFAFGSEGSADLFAWALASLLVDGKMRGLFTVLFGASMLLVADRAEADGRYAPDVHYRRMVWLLLFGAVHAYAMWHGDILMLYAAVGMAAFLFRHMETHRLFTLGVTLVLGQCIWMASTAASVLALRNAAAMPGADPALVGQWHAIASQFGPMPANEVARDLALHRGSYAEILAYRLGPGFWLPIRANLYSTLETLGLMLLGMAGLRSGFLTGAWSRDAYGRAARIGFLTGLPLVGALTAALYFSRFETVTVYFCQFALKDFFNLPLILAYAAVVVWWAKGAADGALLRRVAASGRAAFSNYIGTSLICTTLFYGYGLSLYGELNRAALYLIVLAIWAAMLLWSNAWLAHFRYGPLEWLWRSLARGELQPMRNRD